MNDALLERHTHFMCDVAGQGLATFQVTREKSCLSLVSDVKDDLRVLVFNVGRKTRRYERSTHSCVVFRQAGWNDDVYRHAGLDKFTL